MQVAYRFSLLASLPILNAINSWLAFGEIYSILFIPLRFLAQSLNQLRMLLRISRPHVCSCSTPKLLERGSGARVVARKSRRAIKESEHRRKRAREPEIPGQSPVHLLSCQSISCVFVIRSGPGRRENRADGGPPWERSRPAIAGSAGRTGRAENWRKLAGRPRAARGLRGLRISARGSGDPSPLGGAPPPAEQARGSRARRESLLGRAAEPPHPGPGQRLLPERRGSLRECEFRQ